MRVAIIATLLAATAFGGLAQADQAESAHKAYDLGVVLGSESACAVTLDASAIKRWIGENIDAGDMKFTSTLTVITEATQRSFAKMSRSLQDAHCTQIRRIVEKFGLGVAK